MFNYTCLNPISGVCLDLFSDYYKNVDDIKYADMTGIDDLGLKDELLGKWKY